MLCYVSSLFWFLHSAASGITGEQKAILDLLSVLWKMWLDNVTCEDQPKIIDGAFNIPNKSEFWKSNATKPCGFLGKLIKETIELCSGKNKPISDGNVLFSLFLFFFYLH